MCLLNVYRVEVHVGMPMHAGPISWKRTNPGYEIVLAIYTYMYVYFFYIISSLYNISDILFDFVLRVFDRYLSAWNLLLMPLEESKNLRFK
jgi:hypothetical protein